MQVNSIKVKLVYIHCKCLHFYHNYYNHPPDQFVLNEGSSRDENLPKVDFYLTLVTNGEWEIREGASVSVTAGTVRIPSVLRFLHINYNFSRPLLFLALLILDL